MNKPAPDPTPRFQVQCNCGWTQAFSRGWSGLEIACGKCGRTHRIPMVGIDDADADEEARLVMEKVVNQQPRDEAPAQAPGAVRLKPFFVLSALLCVVAIVAGALVRPFYPMGVVIIGGAASWPLGLFVAWLGQRSQLKKRAAR